MSKANVRSGQIFCTFQPLQVSFLGSPRCDVLVHGIERQISQRTWGRVHGLEVEVVGDRLVVHGRTATYYAKQLALEGALEAIGSTDVSSVELDIQVGAAPPSQHVPLAARGPAYSH